MSLDSCPWPIRADKGGLGWPLAHIYSLFLYGTKSMILLDDTSDREVHCSVGLNLAQKIYVLCLLEKNLSAVHSADKSIFHEPEKDFPDLNHIDIDISSD